MPTPIEWTGETLNQQIGCSKQSPGCLNCYATIQANIRSHHPNAKIAEKFAGTVKSKKMPDGTVRFEWTGKINFDLETLKKPLFWRDPRMIFVNSLSDLFHKNVLQKWIDLFFAMACLTPRHTYQVLTKCPENAVEYFSVGKEVLIERWSNAAYDFGLTEGKDADDADAIPCRVYNYAQQNFPLPNVWMIASTENQKYAEIRVPLLLKIPAAVRGLSIEPALGEIRLDRIPELRGQWGCGQKHRGTGTPDCPHELHHHHDERCKYPLDWIIYGFESGNKARPGHPNSACNMRDYCIGNQIPFFFKQWGDWMPASQLTDEQIDKWCYKPRGKRELPDSIRRLKVKSCVVHPDGSVRSEFTTGAMQMFKIGKKKSGRILDGRTWNQFPS